jgi:hypothetical protein
MITKLYAGVVGDPLNTSGPQLAASVNQLIDTHVSHLKALPTAANAQTDTVYNVVGISAGLEVFGGTFIYDQSASKSLHNGVTLISPESLVAWDGNTTNIPTLMGWTGTGTGLWVATTLNVVEQDTTLSIPITQLPKFVEYLSYHRISPDAIVRLSVANGTLTLTSTLTLAHPDSNSIEIVGNEATPASCVITVSGAPTFDGVVVPANTSFRKLSGFKFSLASKALLANNFTALLVLNGGCARAENIVSDNWYYGVTARNGGVVTGQNITVSNGGDVGVHAYNGGIININSITVTNCSDPDNPWGFGIQAEFGGAISVSNAIVSGCKIGGIAALSNGTVRCHNSNSSNNTGSGFYAQDGGAIENHNSTGNNNTRYGQEVIRNGSIFGNGLTLTGNTLGARSPVLRFDNGSLGARLVAFDGDMRIDTNGTNNINFNTAGGLQAQIQHSSTSNSWPVLKGSGTSQPSLEAAGSNSSVDLNLKAKSTGRVFLASQRQNYLAIQGADSGTPPAITPEGVDANIDCYLTPKGTTGRYLMKRDNIPEFADDAAAATGGLALGKLYRTGSVLKIRVA